MPRRRSVKIPSDPHKYMATYEKLVRDTALEHVDHSAFEGLDDEDRKFVLEWLTTAALTGEADNVYSHTLWDVDYWTKPVDIEQFINDPQYLGFTCSELYPVWRGVLLELFSPDRKCNEFIITGSLGIGKTSIASVAMAYKAYQIACMRDPVRHFGLMSTARMVFGIYSVTKSIASDTAFDKVQQLITNSPWFQRNYPWNEDKTQRMEFLKHRFNIMAGSRVFHAIGLDVQTFLLDEANYMETGTDETGKVTGRAQEIYNTTAARMQTRFQRDGQMPGMMFLISSKNLVSSFVDERIREVCPEYKEGQRGWIADHVYLADYALWEAKPAGTYKTRYFRVEVGDRVAHSRVLRASDEPRRGARIVKVPMDFIDRFRVDPDQALRDVAGVSTLSTSPFIRDIESVHDACVDSLSHPFTREQIRLSTKDDEMLQDYWRQDVTCRVEESRWVPKISQYAPRYMHVDLSITGDSCGIAMLHQSGIIRARGKTKNGLVTHFSKPLYLVDFVLRINPPTDDGRIDFEKIRSFIIFLRTIYNLRTVSFDGFQSEMMMQLLRKDGISAVLTSIDRSENVYLELRDAYYEHRLWQPAYQPLIDELTELYRDVKKGKIDHPARSRLTNQKGSKDCSDAVAGALWNCTHDPRPRDDDVIPVYDKEDGDTKKTRSVTGDDGEPARILEALRRTPEMRDAPVRTVAGMTRSELEKNLR